MIKIFIALESFTRKLYILTGSALLKSIDKQEEKLNKQFAFIDTRTETLHKAADDLKALANEYRVAKQSEIANAQMRNTLTYNKVASIIEDVKYQQETFA